MISFWLAPLSHGSEPPASAGTACSRVAYVRDRDLWVLDTSKKQEPRKLTSDGRASGHLPLWNSDGARLTHFIKPKEGERDFALVARILTQAGGKVEKTYSLPKDVKQPLRWISKIEERTPGRLALAGSSNPSMDAHCAWNLESPGDSSDCYYGSEFALSPDRRRLAYVGYWPHFYPRDDFNEYVEIDGVNVYSNISEKTETAILTDIVWSPDSRRVAFVVTSRQKPYPRLIVAEVPVGSQRPRPQEWDLSGVGVAGRPRWRSAQDIVVSVNTETLAVRVGEPGVARLSGDALFSLTEEIRLEKREEAARSAILAKLGVQEASWWCPPPRSGSR